LRKTKNKHMESDLHWLDGTWRGRLAIAPRPRGADWLTDEVAKWKQAGIGVVLSLLTSEEEQELGLAAEPVEVTRQGMEFRSFPIPDRHIPSSETSFAQTIEKIDRDLKSGKNVVVHCRQGIGRSGLVAACLLIGGGGLSPGAAVSTVSAGRGTPIPDTEEQREWIDHYAVALGPK
jgi:protein-tyrosine phosphatase